MGDDSSSITEPVDVIVSAGPYTFDDDLAYQPLEKLIETCIEQKPDVVVLVIEEEEEEGGVLLSTTKNPGTHCHFYLDGTLCLRKSS